MRKYLIKRVMCLLLSVTLVLSSIIICDYHVFAKKNVVSFECTKTVKNKKIKISVVFETRKEKISKKSKKKDICVCTLKKTGAQTSWFYYRSKNTKKCKNYKQVLNMYGESKKVINAYNKCAEDAFYSALILKMAKKKHYYVKRKVNGRMKRVKQPVDESTITNDLNNMIVNKSVSTIIKRYFSENTPSATKIALKSFKKQLKGYGFPIELYDAFNSVRGLIKGYKNLVNDLSETQKNIYKHSAPFIGNIDGRRGMIKMAKERLRNNRYAAELYNQLMKYRTGSPVVNL